MENHKTIFYLQKFDLQQTNTEKKNNGLITEEKELATAMNIFFVNITESLYLKKDDDSSVNPINPENINDILEKH